MRGRDPNKLTEKEKKFCAEYVSGDFMGNGTRSYMAAYGTDNTFYACLSAVRVLKRPKVQAEILRLKEGAGLTDKFVYQRIRAGLDANVVAAYRGKATETSIPDYGTRHKYLDLSAKLLDMFPTQKVESRSINIDVQLEKLPPAELSKLLTAMAKQVNANPGTKTKLLEETESKS